MLCTSYPPLCIAVPRTVIIPISFVQFFFLTDSARKFKHLSLFLGCNFSVPYALSNPVYTAAIIIILLFLVATVFPRTPLARALCPFLYPNLLKMKENKKKKEKKKNGVHTSILRFRLFLSLSVYPSHPAICVCCHSNTLRK